MRVIELRALRAEKGIPYTVGHLRRLWNAGKFPQPINFGNRLVFDEAEIDAWLDAKREEARR